jgi:fumarylacetoacetate (FAA) hydrolase
MRFATFRPERDSAPRAGVVLGDRVVDLGMTLLDLLQDGSLRGAGTEAERAARSMTAASRVHALSEVALDAPLARPPSVRDFYAFEAHVKTARAKRGLDMVPEWYEFPVFYFSNHSAVYGPGAEVPYPRGSEALDYELELACVIGSGGSDIPEGEAESHIAGYMVMNDWSARDIQYREMKVGLGPAKGKDFATSLGPWLVTPDELESRRVSPGRYDLPMEARVNGRLYSKGNFVSIHWTFSQMIAWASANTTLYPGDVLGSGTVGTGCIAELGPERYGWLKPGDEVELAVHGIGVLTNRVRAQPNKATEAMPVQNGAEGRH